MRTLLVLAILLFPAPGRADCPTDGDGGDPALNELKNRADQPARPAAMEVAQILALKGAGPRQPRAHWTAAQRQTIAATEGAGVVVSGYLLGAKEEGPEAANCHGEDRDDHDVHIWLAAAPNDPKSRAVVVEITPRQHDRRWTLAALHRLARQHVQVRVTGWLMFDQEHGPDVGRSRGTLWEIHPITGIEELSDGDWRPVGGL
jgi:hypothetical protein